MIYCKKCGTPLPDDAKFCSECGQSTEELAASQNPTNTHSAGTAPKNDPSDSPAKDTPPKGYTPGGYAPGSGYNPYGSPYTPGGYPPPYGNPYGTPYGSPYTPAPQPRKINMTYLILAILEFIFCGGWLAIWPFVHVLNAQKAPTDELEALQLKKAKKALIVTFVIGLVVSILYIAFIVIGIMAGM